MVTPILMPDELDVASAVWLNPDACPETMRQALASIATHAWKARTRMRDAVSGEVLEEMKKISRSIDGIFESLAALDIEVKDHTGQPFDYGLPLKVVTTQPTAGIAKEQVIETLKPTIYWRQRIIQTGEVVLATPSSATSL